jgi:hypothetical protein
LNISGFLKKQFDYWREMILFSIAGILFILAFAIPYLLWLGHVPTVLILFFSIIIMPSCILLAIVTMGFMKSVPVGGWWSGLGWIPQEPMTVAEILVDLDSFYGKYRKFILIDAGVNVIFFIILAVYFLLKEEGMGWELASRSTGAFIFLLWIILNGTVVVASIFSMWSASVVDGQE